MTQRTREEIEREIIDVAGDRGWLRGRGKRPPPTPGCDQRLTELFAELAALAPDPQPAQEVREYTSVHDWPYDRTFNAIAAATSVCAGGAGINISVEAFAKSFGPFPHLAQPASEVWRDMASAPKDGSEVDLWADGRRYPDCHWHCGEWLYWSSSSIDEEPTHKRIVNPTRWVRLAPPVEQAAPIKAPEGCPCFDETDCAQATICRAVDDTYRKLAVAPASAGCMRPNSRILTYADGLKAAIFEAELHARARLLGQGSKEARARADGIYSLVRALREISNSVGEH